MHRKLSRNQFLVELVFSSVVRSQLKLYLKKRLLVLESGGALFLFSGTVVCACMFIQ